MRQRIVSRTERRVEKKQTLTFLVMVLAVSLVSFALGVMVGRVSSRPEVAMQPEIAPARIAVAVESSPPPATEPVPASSQELTFFDTLPKGEQSPMGSGINLPPKPKAHQEKPAPISSPPAPPPERAPAAAPSAAAAPSPHAAQVKAAPSTPSNQETYTLQVGSFQDPADAGKLQDHLATRGYSSYTEQADLGVKGIWTRVIVGPYDSDQAATKTASRLLAEEKITALIRRK